MPNLLYTTIGLELCTLRLIMAGNDSFAFLTEIIESLKIEFNHNLILLVKFLHVSNYNGKKFSIFYVSHY